MGNFLSREPILYGENVNEKKTSFDANHRYSIQLYMQLYCTIVETNYQWTLSDFSFDEGYG